MTIIIRFLLPNRQCQLIMIVLQAFRQLEWELPNDFIKVIKDTPT